MRESKSQERKRMSLCVCERAREIKRVRGREGGAEGCWIRVAVKIDRE